MSKNLITLIVGLVIASPILYGLAAIAVFLLGAVVIYNSFLGYGIALYALLRIAHDHFKRKSEELGDD